MGSHRSKPRQAWGPQARVEASGRVREIVSKTNGLLRTCELVAEEIKELVAARTVSISFIENGTYRDLVNVGYLGPGEQRLPKNTQYPETLYPTANQLLLSQRAYVSTESPTLRAEHRADPASADAGCFMGVPIIAGNELRGELFATRAKGAAVFTHDDVEVVRDLLTPLGTEFPGLVARQRELDPLW